MMVNKLIDPKEIIMRKACLIVSSLIFLSLIIAAFLINIKIGFIIVISLHLLYLIILFIINFIKRLYVGFLQGYCIKISPTQYQNFYQLIEDCWKKLTNNKAVMPRVYLLEQRDVFDFKSLRALGKNYIFIPSHLMKMLEENQKGELCAVIGRELAHSIYYNRVNLIIRILLTPSLFIPFLGSAYRRCCAHTADRFGFYCTGENFGDTINGFTICFAGNYFNKELSANLLTKQTKGFIYKLLNLLSNTPPFPSRINRVTKFQKL